MQRLQLLPGKPCGTVDSVDLQSRARAARRPGRTHGLHVVVVVAQIAHQEPGSQGVGQTLAATVNIQRDQPAAGSRATPHDGGIVGEVEVAVPPLVPILRVRGVTAAA